MAQSNAPKKTWSVKRIVIMTIVAILVVGAFLLYNNLNRLLSNALLQSFEKNIISDVYELKFEKLTINPFDRTLHIFNVTFQPRSKPRKEYRYINSSIHLSTEKLTLVNVEIMPLLRSNKLFVERISVTKPDVELKLDGKTHQLLPYKDSTAVTVKKDTASSKPIDAFSLLKFQLIDAAIHVKNLTKEREFKIQNFSITLDELSVSQLPGEYLIKLGKSDVTIGEFDGHLKKGPLQHFHLKDYQLTVDSLELQKTMDTLTFSFHDLNTGLHELDIQTKDSVAHLTLQSFDLSYLKKSIQLTGISYKPNVSDAELQKKYEYQHPTVSGTISSLSIVQLNFDSLIHHRSLFIDEIVLDSVTASIYKDKTKPLDKNKFPPYLGQTVMSIPLPLRIKKVTATNVQLINKERKPDSAYAQVSINKATLEVKNLTNRAPQSYLTISADASIEGKAHVNALLIFHYPKPQFDFDVAVHKFNLADLNPMIEAYTPASITKGTLDEIAFSGVAGQSSATGSLKFLYHDLEIDLELQKKAKWKSSIIAFAANTIINSSNPGSTDLPPRIVQFQIERDLNKGFVNVLIKSLLNGLKETMIMSKENRKAYQKARQKSDEAKNLK